MNEPMATILGMIGELNRNMMKKLFSLTLILFLATAFGPGIENGGENDVHEVLGKDDRGAGEVLKSAVVLDELAAGEKEVNCDDVEPAAVDEESSQHVFDVTTFGAKGDGRSDDTQAFQNAFNAAIAVSGKVIIPSPSQFYKITRTIDVLPLVGNQVWIHVEAWGRGGAVRYYGTSNKPVFKIVGLKGALWTGLNVAIGNGLSGVQAFDIDTTPSAESTSFVTFKDFYLDLGDQPNNDGFRLGHNSGGGADISNYQWENCTVFGTGKPGQIAYHIEGNNTLSQTWMGGFVASCDRAYSNSAGSGAKYDRGNGSVYFFGMGCSHNNIDYDINFEQTYLISGGRYEVGNSFLKTGVGSYHAAITVENVQINDYKSNYLFDINTTATMVITNCRMNKQSGAFTDLITLSSEGGAGTIIIDGGGTNADNLVKKERGTWKLYTRGLGKFSDRNGVVIGGYYPDYSGK